MSKQIKQQNKGIYFVVIWRLSTGLYVGNHSKMLGLRIALMSPNFFHFHNIFLSFLGFVSQLILIFFNFYLQIPGTRSDETDMKGHFGKQKRTRSLLDNRRSW